MKKLNNAVDRFCYRHPRFGIPNLMIYIVIANAIIWVFSLMGGGGILYEWLCFSPYHILRGQIWRLFSFALLPYSTGFFALIAFYFYYFIGSTIESEWGSGKFTVYFFSGMLLTVVYGFILYFTMRYAYGGTGILEWLSVYIGNFVSAYYIYLSMFFTFATLYPDMQVLLFFIIPIKMKWLGILDALFFLSEILTLSFPLNLLQVVAVLNYLLFCGGWLFDYVRPARVRQRRKSTQFRNEMHRIRYEERNRPYTRKCAVCGRTDTDYPDLEFRYCSRCEGYHCFCMDHIDNHVHFTE